MRFPKAALVVLAVIAATLFAAPARAATACNFKGYVSPYMAHVLYYVVRTDTGTERVKRFHGPHYLVKYTRVAPCMVR